MDSQYIMIECIHIKQEFSLKNKTFIPNELYLSDGIMRQSMTELFVSYAKRTGNRNIFKVVDHINFDSIFKNAHKDGDFRNLVIVRYGGIGDLIALSSIIDYFIDAKVHFITNARYFPIFEWFINKPKLYSIQKPIFKHFDKLKLDSWVKYNGEGVIEIGDQRNWFELFFSFIGEDNPDIEMLRPELSNERINNKPSNIKGNKTLLICNKATAMMRTIKVSDIYNSLPKEVKKEYDIFAYEFNVCESDKGLDIHIIKGCDMQTFFLDCYDADMVISVDTGALHFREGIHKPAIGLYNSFTTESRTKHYQYTKSFDVSSDCDLQPCFIHERADLKHCPKGKGFAAPCFDSDYNKTLIKQLKTIFNENL